MKSDKDWRLGSMGDMQILPGSRHRPPMKKPMWIIVLVLFVCVFLIIAYMYPPQSSSSACYIFSSRGCKRFSDWLPPAPAREYTDEEIASRVVIKDILTSPPVVSKKSKIAFMFLSPGSLPLEKLWDNFFQGHEGKFSVYVHASKSKPVHVSRYFVNRDIRSGQVVWGKISMVDAERRILATALQDPDNQHFVLLSDSCVPLYHFDYIYNYLMHTNISYVDCFKDPGPHGNGRYSDRMLPEVEVKDFRKGAQWFSMKRQHAVIVMADYLYYSKFRAYCQPGLEGKNCIADEHYLPTFFQIVDPGGIANWSVTHVDWSERKWHPKSYRAHDVTYELLKNITDQLLVDEVIPNLVGDNTNQVLTMLPTHEEIKAAVFGLNKDGAPGPDGFGAYFFQTYWAVIHKELIDAVLQFFVSGWILPNYNANTLILIPKIPNADKVEQYRPIAMANFKFKVISKIIADRMACILPSIVSNNQKGFIKGRNIKDCLCLASEVVNTLDKKAFGGNLALKIDITKAFDTLDWKFLLKVLKCFGFNQTFCNWIEVILASATLSISINGSQEGYFKCTRGVRQGDPLSPLLFCLAEEVLSRGITKLVDEGKVKLITGARNIQIPSHCLYADDIMIYCRGNIDSLLALHNLFNRYANSAGQIISARKSTIFAGGISQSRLQSIVHLLGFEVGTLPFTYLGVPIFKGKPKSIYLQPIADRIKAKLSAWKASLLSIAGRVQLVKSVIFSMLTHSMSIYSWPVSLLKDIEKWIKNFIWSGDTSKRKLVTVAWKKMCKPYSEGGLGLRSLISLNEAFNLKLCFDLLKSNEDWAQIVRGRTIRGNCAIKYHILSSIWSSIKGAFPRVMENTYWLLGDGRSINFWLDAWCGDPIKDVLHLDIADFQGFPKLVSDFIQDGQWSIPQEIDTHYPAVRHIIMKIIIPFEEKTDDLVWKHTTNGEFSLKDSYSFINQPSTTFHWAKHIWSTDIPPSKSMVAWRVIHDKMPTDEKLQHRGLSFASMCSLCSSNSETSFHLFFECKFAFMIWCWFASILDSALQFQSIEDIWTICDRGWSPQCKSVIEATIVNIFSAVWYYRNHSRFQDSKPTWQIAVNNIVSAGHLSGNNTSKVSNSSLKDFITLKKFDVQLNPPKQVSLKEVFWSPPSFDWIKCNTDGAATSTTSACGGIFRDSNSNFISCFAENLGGCTAFLAELSAVMKAIEIASHNNWKNVWIESDSSLVVMAFSNDAIIPYCMRNRWLNCKSLLYQMNFMVSHIYREGNKCADKLASIGLDNLGVCIWLALPDFLREFFVHDRLGLPNYRVSSL